MQRAEDREVDDKDDRGGGRPGLLASISTSTSFNTITPTQRPPSKRKREDTHHEGDEGEDGQEADQEEKGSHEEIMPPYKSKVRVLEEYHIIGFISSGTYGRVYKARSKLPGNTKEYAIKKSGATFLYIF